MARETYIVGATEDAGKWVLDPTDAFGAGAVGATAPTAGVITFTGLSPADTDTPAAIFDVILSTAADNATLQNGGLLNGFDSMQVVDNSSTFETFRFANKTTARIMGNSGADTFSIDYTTQPAGLQTLNVYGHIAPGVVGQPADDNLGDLMFVDATAAGVTANNLFGQGGDDDFTNFGSFDMTGLQSPVTIDGGAGIMT